jgi:phosphonate transport system substrate-binding protein
MSYNNRPTLFALFFIMLVITVMGMSPKAFGTELPKIVPKKKTTVIKFGVYASDNSNVLYNKLRPILDHIQGEMAKKLRTKVKIPLIIYPSYDSGRLAIVRGDIDIGRFGVASTIIAQRENPKIGVVAVENRISREKMHGSIIVSAFHTDVNSLEDLKGTTFAFGNPRSTTGHYIAKYELVKAGLRASDFRHTAHFKKHVDVFNQVALGNYEAGTLKTTAVNRYNKSGLVKVLIQFKSPSKTWLMREGFPPKLLDYLRPILLGKWNPRLIKEIKISGFSPYIPRQYEEARQAVDKIGDFDAK